MRPGLQTPFDPHALRTPDGARASLCAHGAHLLEWQPAGEQANRLYLSPQARYAAGAAIRGGIPVLFPQFGLFGDLPKHGLVRDQIWALLPGTDASRAVYSLTDNAATRAVWPQGFAIQLAVALESKTLTIELAITNTGDTPLRFTAGLHTYLAVDDLDALRLHGLAGLDYLDAVHQLARVKEPSMALVIEGEVDRVYLDASAPLQLIEPTRHTRITQRGFTDVVVWNPGPEKARELNDLPDADYRCMVCVEAAVIGNPVVLAPGERWQGAQVLGA